MFKAIGPRHWRALIHVDEALWADRGFMLKAICCRWQCAQRLGLVYGYGKQGM